LCKELREGGGISFGHRLQTGEFVESCVQVIYLSVRRGGPNDLRDNLLQINTSTKRGKKKGEKKRGKEKGKRKWEKKRGKEKGGEEEDTSANSLYRFSLDSIALW
jgi:hypothetical protein